MSAQEIIITVQGNKICARTFGGAVGNAEFKLEDLPKNTIAVFQDWLQRGKLDKRKELEVLGMHLFQTLFVGEVRSLFEGQRGRGETVLLFCLKAFLKLSIFFLMVYL